MVSVDAKKKELIGNYKNNGQDGRKKGDPIKVLSHDFPDPNVPKAVPYGVYDVDANSGGVNVGISADTAELAVESIQKPPVFWFVLTVEEVMDTDYIYGKENCKNLRIKHFLKLQSFISLPAGVNGIKLNTDYFHT